MINQNPNYDLIN